MDLRIKNRGNWTYLLIASLLALACVPAAAQQWPKWRGPDGSGISQETNIARQWPVDGPDVLWKVGVGSGYASPVAVDDVIYIFSQDGKDDTLCAVDINTQSKLWSKNYPNSWKDRSYPGTRATPTVVGDMIYTLGGGGDLCCWRKSDGSIIWRKNVLELTKAENLKWGCSSSPLVDGNYVFVQGGYNGPIALCFNRTTGELVWQSQYTGYAGYAPIVKAHSKIDDEDMLIVYGGIDVVAMDIETGKTLWSYPYETEWKVNAATPITKDGQIFFTNEYRSGKATMLDVSMYRTKVLWTNDQFCSRVATPIVEDGYIYGHDRGKLKCIKWHDGSEVWSSNINLGMGGTLVKAGELSIAQSDDGWLYLLEMNSGGVKLLSSFRLLHEKKIWATPLIYKGRLYVKSADRLMCLDISPKERP